MAKPIVTAALKAAYPSSFLLPPEIEIKASTYRQALHPKVRGAVRAGLMLEKNFAKGLTLWSAERTDWKYLFQYGLRGSDGSLHLPDHVLVSEEKVICFETKLTFSPKGIEQLHRYSGLLSRHFGDLPVVQVLVAETLRPGVANFPFIKSLEEALLSERQGPHIWHLWQPMKWLTLITPPLVLPEVDFDPSLLVKKKGPRKWPMVTVRAKR